MQLEIFMIPYVNRSREVYQALKGCPIEREVYDALDYHRPPRSNISDKMTYRKLSELSGTDRRRIGLILDRLVEKGLIQIVLTKKKYVFQCLLVEITKSEVVKLDNDMTERDAKYQESIASIPD